MTVGIVAYLSFYCVISLNCVSIYRIEFKDESGAPDWEIYELLPAQGW